MPLYTFRTAYASKPVVVAPQAGGTAVATGTTAANGSFTATLPAGEWVASVNSGQTFWPVAPVLGTAPQPDLDDLAGAAPALRMPAFAGLRAGLADPRRSLAVQVLSDSTGVSATRWPYRLAQSLAALYPEWTVESREYVSATEDYGPATVLQTGTGGARYLNSSTGSYGRLLVADPVTRPHLTGAIDVRIKLSMDDWSRAGGLNSVAGKSGSDPLRGWYVGFSSTGLMFFAFSTNGLGANISVMYSSVAPALVDGATAWCRWVWTPDNGAAGRTLSCYTSTDGVTWVQVGTTVTAAGAVALFDNAARGYECGGSGQAPSAGCRTYEIQIRDGVDGPNIVPALPDLWPPLASLAATYVGAPTLSFLVGAVSGTNISYLGDTARLRKLCPDYGQAVGFLSTSHNEGNTIGRDWTTLYGGWRQGVQARMPGAPLVALTQNPERADTTWNKEHAQRRINLITWCTANGYPVIDTYGEFLAYPGGWDPALMGDSVHPSSAGSDVWRDAILSRITA